MENAAGRVANTIVCTRCEASVDACNYSAISVDQQHRGPARVVPDPPESDTVSLLVDFLAASLNQAPPGSSEHSHVINVVRTLLKQNKNQVSDDDDDDEVEEEDDAGANDCISAEEQDALARVEEFLADERNFPPLIKCTFNNTKRRNYVLNLPENPKTEVPSSPIPDNEASRLSAAEAAGLIQLANYLAPEHPTAEAEPDHVIDVHDLDIICQLAAKTLGVTHALISVMGANHEHVLASVGTPKFAGAAVPRQHTLCQHQLMAPGPLMLVHPEADLRLQNIETIKNLGPKCYIGFPVTAPTIGDGGREQIAVGTLCCFDSEPRSELTHTQYATLQSLARTASYLVQRKGQQIQQQVAQESRES
ncbi:hypothetical protein PHYBOEH_009562 [Phytophthora boehmeriae]|uniref:GAF domain-containing protein n=1 Tax=Phytophthora boehmeriae TaxID=109152 RepID=A0A8T1VSP0_9STRA|nr:hypothetical protein PHYBOEH_009562 [Phytophthora boehmeriae]